MCVRASEQTSKWLFECEQARASVRSHGKRRGKYWRGLDNGVTPPPAFTHAHPPPVSSRAKKRLSKQGAFITGVADELPEVLAHLVVVVVQQGGHLVHVERRSVPLSVRVCACVCCAWARACVSFLSNGARGYSKIGYIHAHIVRADSPRTRAHQHARTPYTHTRARAHAHPPTYLHTHISIPWVLAQLRRGEVVD